MKTPSVVLLAVLGLSLHAAPLRAGPRETTTVDTAAQTLQEITAIPAKGIPRALLADAEGMAIVPGVVKLGFVVAGRHGRGVVLVRNPDRTWGNPVFVSLTGGSVGWQAGVQATDVILVFKTRKSVAGLLGGKFTLGADAAVAAGPVGRQAAAATDVQLKAEIYSYSRSRGLFAGVSLEGSAVTVDGGANAAFYGRRGITPAEIQAGRVPAVPASAANLHALLARLAPPAPARVAAVAGPVAGPAPQPVVQPVPRAPVQPAVALEPGRTALAASSRRLALLLDDQWKRYLALPAEVYAQGAPPNVDALRASLRHFDAVKADPKYRALTTTPQFQATDELLRQYTDTRAAAASPSGTRRPVLPPPPAD